MSLLEDTILLIVFFSEDKISPYDYTLNNMIFMIAKESKRLRKIDFTPTACGFYSYKVRSALENLMDDAITIKDGGLVLTDWGDYLVGLLLGELDEDYIDTVRDVVDFFQGLSPEEVLVFLYYRYPEYFKDVKIMQIIEKNKTDLAIELYRKEKISIEALSEILGVSLEYLINLLKKKQLL
jgi:hypothetical protein